MSQLIEKMAVATQGGPFFGLPPEIRNHIYHCLSFSIQNKASAINDLNVSALLFTCHQALNECFGICFDGGIPARLNVSYGYDSGFNTPLHLSMRPGAKTLFRLVSPLVGLQRVDLYQEIQFYGAARDLFCFSVKINKVGMFEVNPNQGRVPAWLKQREHVKFVLESELNLRLRDRTVDTLDFEDLDMIVAACDDYIRAFANPCYD